MVYTGTVTNLSENGMFISTKMSFPLESVFIAVILLGTHTLSVPIKIKRTVSAAEQLTRVEDIGLGVRLLNPSKAYLDFVSETRASRPVTNEDNLSSDQENPFVDLS